MATTNPWDTSSTSIWGNSNAWQTPNNSSPGLFGSAQTVPWQNYGSSSAQLFGQPNNSSPGLYGTVGGGDGSLLQSQITGGQGQQQQQMQTDQGVQTDLLGIGENNKTTTTTQFNPWGPQGDALKNLYAETQKLYADPTQQKYIGLDASALQGLNMIQGLAQGPNPLVLGATGAVRGVESGNNAINTGGMFSSIYGGPGVGTNQFSSLYTNPGINNAQQYQDLYNTGGVQNAGQYQSLFDNGGIKNAQQYQDLYDTQAISNGNQYQSLFTNQPSADNFGQLLKQAQQPGMLSQGIYGNIAQGGQLSVYPKFNPAATSYDANGNPVTTQAQQGAGTQGAPGSGQSAPVPPIGGTANGVGPIDATQVAPPVDPRLTGVPAPQSDPNPYRSAALQDALTNAANVTKAGLSANGRYGGSAYGTAMGNALGQAATNFNLNAYNSDQDRMMQAAQAASQENLALQGYGLQAAQGIGSIQEQNQANKLAAAQGLSSTQAQNQAAQLAAAQGISNVQQQNTLDKLAAAQGLSGVQQQNTADRLAAAQGISNVQGQNAQMKLSAAQGLAGAQNMNIQNQLAAAQGLTGVQGQNIQNQLQAAGMAPAMNQLRYDDANQLLTAGGIRQTDKQNAQNFSWDQLQKQSGLFGSLPGSAGSGSSQSSTQTPWWETLLGLGSAGLGLAGLFT